MAAGLAQRVGMSENEQWQTGGRVRYVGISGRADGPHGRVTRVMKSGVKVRFDDGRTELVHPEDIRRE